MTTAAISFAVIDTETTGFLATDRVIEIGVVQLDRELRPTATWETLVNPGPRRLGPVHVHHISPAAVAQAPGFGQIAGQLIGQLRGRIIVGHNIGFDMDMLNQEFANLGVGEPLQAGFSLDTLALSRNLQLSPDGCFTLDHLRQLHDLPRATCHAALADAEATAELFALAAARFARKLGGLEQLANLWQTVHQAAVEVDWPAIAIPQVPPLPRSDASVGRVTSLSDGVNW